MGKRAAVLGAQWMDGSGLDVWYVIPVTYVCIVFYS